MWSLACMVFEMLTGELLFNPRKDNNDAFGKNDDHLAQMMELLDTPKDEVYQYESEKEDGSIEDNAGEDSSDDEFFGYEKIGNIRYIDRSFMDLGYIGYGDGIFLDKLDAGPNWQFEAN
ncbi:unnamed protein product [Sphagnum balticum]